MQVGIYIFTTGVQSLLVPTLIHLLQPISLQRPMNMTVHDRPKQKWLAFWGSNLNPSSDPDLKVRRLINRLIISSSTGRSFYTSNASLSVWNLRTPSRFANVKLPSFRGIRCAHGKGAGGTKNPFLLGETYKSFWREGRIVFEARG